MRVLVVGLLVALAACSSSDDDTTAATTTSVPGSTTTAAAPTTDGPCAEPAAESCTLLAAGEASGVTVGTALKFSSPEREALQAEQFSAGSSEIEFLFNVIHPERDRWDFTGADRVVAFAREHDLDLTATHVAWDPPAIPSVLPDWVRAITDPDELREVLREHVSVLHDRYGDDIDRLSVVNEPLGNTGEIESANHYAQVLGDDWPAEVFAIAEEAWADTTLVVNDYFAEYLPAKGQGLLALVDELERSGARVDAVGLQGHLFLGEPDWDALDATIAGLDEREMPWAFTEIDVPRYRLGDPGTTFTPEQQAERAAGLVERCLASAGCDAVSFWGIDDGDTWLDDFMGADTQPLLYDAELRPKPMYDAVRGALLAGRP